MLDLENERLLTVKEVSRMLNCSTGTAWNLVGSGDLASLRVRGLRRIRRQSLDDYLARKEASESIRKTGRVRANTDNSVVSDSNADVTDSDDGGDDDGVSQ